MQKLLSFVLCASLIFYSFAGCSISAMNKKPSPVPIDTLKEHPSRGNLVSVFGNPISSDVDKAGVKTDYFKFVDGYHGATKIRAVLYVAGCIVTLCLSELIFWPIEANTMIGMPGTAVASYDENNVVTKLEITDEDGKPWDVNWKKGNETPSGNE